MVQSPRSRRPAESHSRAESFDFSDRDSDPDSIEVGSTASQDHIKRDINTMFVHDYVGFMGKGSEVSLLNRVNRELVASVADQQPSVAHRAPDARKSLHLTIEPRG
jgi:hypothetical protein